MKCRLGLLIMLILSLKLQAQTAQPDSVTIRKVASRDADRSYKLNKTIRKAFRNKQLYSTSDFFKPNEKTTKNPQLLTDSNYVKAFRHTSFDDTIYQIRLNRSKIVIIGVVVAGVAVIVIIIVKIAEAIGNGISHIFDTII